jgi:hypothetical protein
VLLRRLLEHYDYVLWIVADAIIPSIRLPCCRRSPSGPRELSLDREAVRLYWCVAPETVEKAVAMLDAVAQATAPMLNLRHMVTRLY